ncbi:unnamed protein product [[Candida] boidinii]|nr:unnamed protein product [[Candida] boidinii]
MRCSFEETVEILFEAGAAAELDACDGVSQSVILGQMGPFGTGSFELYLNQDKLSNMPSDIPQNVAVTKASKAVEGGATPYDDNRYNDEFIPDSDAGMSFSPMVTSGPNDDLVILLLLQW